MPLAVTHVILTIIVVDLFRDYVLKGGGYRRFFTLHTLMVAGIAGLLPDIDVVFGFIQNLGAQTAQIVSHGGFTHTPVFGLVFLIPAAVLWYKRKYKIATYFFVITFGIIFHVFLDSILWGGAAEGVMWFWPISNQTHSFYLLPEYLSLDTRAAMDAIILLLWLWHEETKHKIRDFI